MKILSKIASLMFIIGGVAFVAYSIIAGFSYLPLLSQTKIFAVMSGSMEPALPLGSLVIVMPADNYLTGDIISFSPDNNPRHIITHRIAAKLYPEGIYRPPVYLTAGDANQKFDQGQIKDGQIIGKLLIFFPYLGYLADFLKKPIGFILFVIIPATIIVWEEIKTIKKELIFLLKKINIGRKDQKTKSPEPINPILPVAVVVLAFLSLPVVASLSYFSDQEASFNNSFAAGFWVTPTPSPNELFFSEYIEGSNVNKALEIYNPTSSPIDLAANGYKVQIYFNGNTNPNVTINLIGVVNSNDVFVLAEKNAHTDILNQADQTDASSWYNGDDTIVLMRNTVIIDVIGQIGFDPGSQWGEGLVSTQDNTLVRKCFITKGDTDGTDPFNLTAEWDGYPEDDFTHLGFHSLCP